jgi:hypothetical protein
LKPVPAAVFADMFPQIQSGGGKTLSSKKLREAWFFWKVKEEVRLATINLH